MDPFPPPNSLLALVFMCLVFMLTTQGDSYRKFVRVLQKGAQMGARRYDAKKEELYAHC